MQVMTNKMYLRSAEIKVIDIILITNYVYRGGCRLVKAPHYDV